MAKKGRAVGRRHMEGICRSVSNIEPQLDSEAGPVPALCLLVKAHGPDLACVYEECTVCPVVTKGHLEGSQKSKRTTLPPWNLPAQIPFCHDHPIERLS